MALIPVHIKSGPCSIHLPELGVYIYNAGPKIDVEISCSALRIQMQEIGL